MGWGTKAPVRTGKKRPRQSPSLREQGWKTLLLPAKQPGKEFHSAVWASTTHPCEAETWNGFGPSRFFQADTTGLTPLGSLTDFRSGSPCRSIRLETFHSLPSVPPPGLAFPRRLERAVTNPRAATWRLLWRQDPRPPLVMRSRSSGRSFAMPETKKSHIFFPSHLYFFLT